MDSKQLDAYCNGPCMFLFKNYTQVYNLFINDMDSRIMEGLLQQLQKIENGQLTQQEASFEVGKILKNIYVDTVMTKQKEQDLKDQENELKIKNERQKQTKQISWNDFKKMT